MPRPLLRQLRLRTGLLPSAPYLGTQARRWQRELPASDPPTAASGSTRARWKPDPPASRAADREPPSPRCERRGGPLYRISPRKSAPPGVSAGPTVTNNEPLRFTRRGLQRNCNGCVSAGRNTSPARQRSRQSLSRAHSLPSPTGGRGPTSGPSPRRYRDFGISGGANSVCSKTSSQIRKPLSSSPRRCNRRRTRGPPGESVTRSPRHRADPRERLEITENQQFQRFFTT